MEFNNTCHKYLSSDRALP